MAAHLDGTTKGMPYTFLPERIELLGEIVSVPDPLDLALIELPRNPKHWLRMPHILAPNVTAGELCLFVGYQARPKSWQFETASNALRPSPLSYLGRVSNPTAERFSIRFNQKQIERHARRNVGKLNGISGSGVFVLRNDSPKLAGIVIEYHAKRSEIVCTNSVVIWELLKQL